MTGKAALFLRDAERDWGDYVKGVKAISKATGTSVFVCAGCTFVNFTGWSKEDEPQILLYDCVTAKRGEGPEESGPDEV